MGASPTSEILSENPPYLEAVLRVPMSRRSGNLESGRNVAERDTLYDVPGEYPTPANGNRSSTDALEQAFLS